MHIAGVENLPGKKYVSTPLVPYTKLNSRLKEIWKLEEIFTEHLCRTTEHLQRFLKWVAALNTKEINKLSYIKNFCLSKVKIRRMKK